MSYGSRAIGKAKLDFERIDPLARYLDQLVGTSKKVVEPVLYRDPCVSQRMRSAVYVQAVGPHGVSAVLSGRFQ
jgi:hypothetical protein